MKKTIALVLVMMIALGALAYYFYTWKNPTPPDEPDQDISEEDEDEEVELDYSDSVDWDKFRGKGITINVYNWGEYISVDEGDGEFDTNAEFEKLTGINVNYSTFATNEELYAKLRGGGTKYDVIIPSDYMLSRMINEGMLEKLDFDNIPNVKYMDDSIDTSYDPDGEYSVPYMWGTLGIIYNKKMVTEPVDSWAMLWNKKYAKQIFMLDSPRDSIGIALKYLGYSMNTVKEQELDETEFLYVKLLSESELLERINGGDFKQSNHVLAYYLYKDKLSLCK